MTIESYNFSNTKIKNVNFLKVSVLECTLYIHLPKVLWDKYHFRQTKIFNLDSRPELSFVQ